MTTTEEAAAARGEDRPADPDGPTLSRSAQRALRRRERREHRLTTDRLVRTGRPLRSALSRVPFVVALIALLGCGIAAVLYLNTKTDESGIRTVSAQQKIADLNLQIEALQRDIAELGATPRIAQQAQALGMVPAGDAAIIVVPNKGSASVIGTPSAVPTPAAAAPAPVTAMRSAPTAAPTTAPASTTGAKATPPPKAAAGQKASPTSAAKPGTSAAPKTTATGKSTAPTTAASAASTTAVTRHSVAAATATQHSTTAATTASAAGKATTTKTSSPTAPGGHR
jgi:hypothetical protein